ncbi:MAG: hypothetical protein CMJ83_11410 [Planctomycetes bacterium]|nr:hypothetical protein [Planctomycetota bacterium]
MQAPPETGKPRGDVVKRVTKLHLPSLTLSGKVCEALGVLALGLGFKLEDRSLLMLGAVLVLGVFVGYAITWLRVKNLEVVVQRPRVARAFEPSPVEVRVTAARSVRGLLAMDPRRPKLGAALHLETVPRGVLTSGRGVETFTRRGRARTGPLAFSCARPLGLAVSERWYGPEGEMLVLAPIGELAGPLRELGLNGRPEQERPSGLRGAGAETLHVRPWQAGDSIRRVHWRSTARIGELMARESEDERGGLLLIGVGGHCDGTAFERRLLEAAISLTATILHNVTRSRREAVLVLPEGNQPVTLRTGSRSALRRAEESLAGLGTDPGWPDWADLPVGAAHVSCVLVHPGRGALPALPGSVERLDAGEAVRKGWFRARGRYVP